MVLPVSRWRQFFARIWGAAIVTVLWASDELRLRHRSTKAVLLEAGLVLMIASLIAYFWKSKSSPHENERV